MARRSISTAKVGQSKSLAFNPRNVLERALKNRFQRKSVLVVPPEILKAHPDKEFVFLNYQELAQSGFWHSGGFKPFVIEQEDSGPTKFQKDFDGLLHRNEMVLAYMPKHEYQERQLEEMVIRKHLKRTDLITKNPELQGFTPTATETVETIDEESLVEEMVAARAGQASTEVPASSL